MKRYTFFFLETEPSEYNNLLACYEYHQVSAIPLLQSFILLLDSIFISLNVLYAGIYVIYRHICGRSDCPHTHII